MATPKVGGDHRLLLGPLAQDVLHLLMSCLGRIAFACKQIKGVGTTECVAQACGAELNGAKPIFLGIA